MANIFQPGDASASQTETATPSPASQAAAKFRADLLGRLLGAGAQKRPSFSQFAGGASMPANVPPGLDSGIAGLLAAMSQPGAFTSSGTKTATGTPGSPSLISDLGQLAALGAAVYQSGALDWILSGVKGAVGINGVNPALGDTTPSYADPSAVNMIYGNDPSMIPGGNASTVPANYPGLADDTSSGDMSWLWNFL